MIFEANDIDLNGIACDVVARFDMGDVCGEQIRFVGIYNRETQEWYTTLDEDGDPRGFRNAAARVQRVGKVVG